MKISNEDMIEDIAHVYVMPFLLALGFINQFLNLCTLSTLPSIGFIYLKASAIADLLSIISLIPFCIRHGDKHNPHSYTAMFYHAHIELPLINALITASALCLVAMTVDRYFSIQRPIAFFNSPDSRSRIRITIFALYCIAFLVFIPSSLQKTLVKSVDYTNNQNSTIWRIDRNQSLNNSNQFKAYLLFREIIARLGPIIILVLLNIAMTRSLRRINIRYHKNRQSIRNRNRDHDRTRISLLLLITTVTFVVCTLPASLLSLYIDYSPNGITLQIFRGLANCLQVSHYSPNFYLYIICSSEYRSAFLLLFGCKKTKTIHKTITGDSATQKLSSNITTRVVRSIRTNHCCKKADTITEI